MDERNCTMCEAGSYQSGAGMGGASNCSACGAGKYQSGRGATGEFSCVLCGPGKYQTGAGMVDSRNCSLCGFGTYHLSWGAINVSSCVLCLPGHFIVNGFSSFVCEACISGSYQPRWGNSTASSCVLCAPGYYQTGTGMQSAKDCIPCAAGTYQTGHGMGSMDNCTLCRQGEYQTANGSTACMKCISGKFNTASTGSAASVCIPIQESFQMSPRSLLISMFFSLTSESFLVLQSEYVTLIAQALGIGVEQARVLAVQEIARRVLPLSRVELGINISNSNCTALLQITGPSFFDLIKASGLSQPSQISSNANCSAYGNVTMPKGSKSTALSQELKNHAIILNSVIVTLLSTILVNQIALQITTCMSFGTFRFKRGVSIYHLIGAVQFLNIFGKMFDRIEPAYFYQASSFSDNHRREISPNVRHYNLSDLRAEVNTTITAASEFRFAYAPSFSNKAG